MALNLWLKFQTILLERSRTFNNIIVVLKINTLLMKEENFHYLGTLFNYQLVIDNLFWMNERVCQALGYPYCLFWCKFYQQFSTHLTFKLSTNFVPGNKIRTKGWARGGLTADKENPSWTANPATHILQTSVEEP